MIASFTGRHAFLSNFYPSPLIDPEMPDLVWRTLEHWYQANKASTLEDLLWVHESESPGVAKKRGRRVELRSDWEEAKLDVMAMGLRLKFEPGSPLTFWLLETDPEELVEGNYWGDRYWGAVREDGDWSGHNHLGRLLMELRDDLLT